MLSRTNLLLVRFYSSSSAFKPVTFKHQLPEKDFKVTDYSLSKIKPRHYKNKNAEGRDHQKGGKFFGPMPVIKAPFSNSGGEERRRPKHKFVTDDRISTEISSSEKYSNGSQTLADSDTKPETERFEYREFKSTGPDFSGDDICSVDFPLSPSKSRAPSPPRDRKYGNRADFRSSSNKSGYKKNFWKNGGHTRKRIEEEYSGIDQSIVQEYDEREHLYGVHPVLLALKANKREIHSVLCKEGLENTNPLVGEIHNICKDRDIEFRSVTGKVFKSVFNKGIVHQGVACCVGYMPVDAFDVDDLDREVDEGLSVSPSLSSDHSQDQNRNTSAEENSSSEAVPFNTDEHNNAQLPIGKTSSAEEIENCPAFATETEKHFRRRLWVILDRVVDPMNVGAVLRSCCYFGVSRVLVTPSSAELSPVVSKASSGASELMHISLLPRPTEQLTQLKARNWHVVATAPQVVTRVAGLKESRLHQKGQCDEKPTSDKESLSQGRHLPDEERELSQESQPLHESRLHEKSGTNVKGPLEGTCTSDGETPFDTIRTPEDAGLDASLRPSAETDGKCDPVGCVNFEENYGPDERSGHTSLNVTVESLGNPCSEETRVVAVQDFVFERDTVLIVGNEGAGISSSIAAIADTLLTVPSVARPSAAMDGLAGEDSSLPCLNVSSATAVILHAITASASRSC